MADKIRSVEDIDPKYSRNYSDDSFWDKITSVLKSAGLELIYKALQLYYAMQNPNCPMTVKAGIIAALGYFISPIDLIPDFIPVVGFTDDLAAVGAALVMAHMYIDSDVKRMARQKIDDIFGAGTSDALEDSPEKPKALTSENIIDAEYTEEAGPSSNDAIEMLKKLKELLDAGIITQDEFDQKKEELMKRI